LAVQALDSATISLRVTVIGGQRYADDYDAGSLTFSAISH